VFALGPRDAWVGWDAPAKRERLRYVVDAFVLGATPPYARLLCGKLVALLITSDEVREAFSRRYAGRASLIRLAIVPSMAGSPSSPRPLRWAACSPYSGQFLPSLGRAENLL
jgi:hypothetical protein